MIAANQSKSFRGLNRDVLSVYSGQFSARCKHFVNPGLEPIALHRPRLRHPNSIKPDVYTDIMLQFLFGLDALDDDCKLLRSKTAYKQGRAGVSAWCWLRVCVHNRVADWTLHNEQNGWTYLSRLGRNPTNLSRPAFLGFVAKLLEPLSFTFDPHFEGAEVGDDFKRAEAPNRGFRNWHDGGSSVTGASRGRDKQ